MALHSKAFCGLGNALELSAKRREKLEAFRQKLEKKSTSTEDDGTDRPSGDPQKGLWKKKPKPKPEPEPKKGLWEREPKRKDKGKQVDSDPEE